MSLKPNTWRRSSPRLAAHAAAVLSCSTFITTVGITLSAAWLALLLLTHDYESSPPFMILVATATGLTWIWRMQLARGAREDRADEELIQAVRRRRPDNEARLREEEAFRQITEYYNEEGDTRGLD